MAFNVQAAVDAAISDAVDRAVAAARAEDAAATAALVASIRAECAQQITAAMAADAEQDAVVLAARDAEIARLQARVAELEAAPQPQPEPEPEPEPEPQPEPPPADPMARFPGAHNTGHRNAPGYPGQLTPWSGGSLVAGRTYSFVDFDGATVNAAGVTFIGCRFRSNWVDGWNVRLANSGLTTFKFCTFEPSAAVIPNPAWPSAGAGRNVNGSTGGGFEPYMIAHGAGYQYGIYQAQGGLLMEDCDVWGFGNAVVLFGSSQKTIRRCWIHDAAAEGSGSGMYHQDGPGHLDGSGCSNVLIEGCTIASLGNTNGIAFQAGTYNNIVVRDNFLSGFGFCVDIGHGTVGNTNLVFESNIIATDIGWRWGPLYTDFSANFRKAGSSWKGNRLRVLPGTTPHPQSSGKYTAADDGKFVHPSGVYSAADWAA